MFCRYCGQQFEAWINPIVDYKETTGCRDCMKAPPKYHLRGPKPSHLRRSSSGFCIDCGIEIGEIHGNCKRCNDCKSKLKYPIIHNPNPVTHSLAARRWQKTNKKKHKVSSFAYYHQDEVEILYECRCNVGKKHQHHWNYDRPLEIILLCHRCHRVEHERLRLLAEKADTALRNAGLGKGHKWQGMAQYEDRQ